MKHQEIIDRILSNCGIKNEDSGIIFDVKTSIMDTYSDIYTDAEAPNSIYEEQVEESEVISPTITTDGVDTSVAGTYEIDNLGTITISNLEHLESISFTFAGSHGGVPTDYPSVTVEVLDSKSDVLYTETFEYDDISIDEDIVVPLAIKKPNLSVVIYINNPSGWDNAFLTNLVVKQYKYSIELPSDAFIPQEVVFSDGSNKTYASKEMPRESYFRWRRHYFNYTNEDEVVDITKIEQTKTVMGSTYENEAYDGIIGFYFEYTLTGKIKLFYNPTFAGYISVNYSQFPSVSIDESVEASAHKAFQQLLITGGTVHMLEKMLMWKDITEVRLASIQLGLRMNKARFDKLLAKFTSWFNRQADTPIIVGFDFLNDQSMEIL